MAAEPPAASRAGAQGRRARPARDEESARRGAERAHRLEEGRAAVRAPYETRRQPCAKARAPTRRRAVVAALSPDRGRQMNSGGASAGGLHGAAVVLEREARPLERAGEAA